jgi:flagellar M-ring protein FliF
MSPQSVISAARRLDGSRRFLILGLLAAAVAVVAVGGRWASTPAYVPLYRDLELSESGQMADQLTKAGIRNRLDAGGTELQVPAAELARARVALAKVGLPTNGRPGLELFDKPSWGMTDFTQRVTYQRALEGELARTIAAIRGVERAQVHLVLTTSSALRRSERPASASVVLSLKGGQSLAPDAVQGITYIVSNSVEQLSSENVAVMDDAGHVLSVPTGDGTAGLSNKQLEVQRAMERHVTEKIEEMLATVVGPGRSRAEVSAELSFDQVDRTVEAFDPDGQVLENEQRSEGNGGSGDQTIVNNSYQNSRRLEKSVEATGKLKRLTIAVLVDQKSLKGGTGGRPKLETDQLQAMVANAAGVDSTRGDRVSVVAVAFESALPKDGPGTGPEKLKTDPIQVVERVSRPAIGVVAIIVLIVMAFVALRVGGGSAAAPTSATAMATGGASAALPAGAIGGEGAVPGAPQLRGVNTPAGGVEVEFQRKLVAGSSDRLDAAAQVVKSWLAES